MSVTREEVAKIASLARISMSEDALDRIGGISRDVRNTAYTLTVDKDRWR